MKLHLSSLTTLAATLSLLAACTPAVIANGAGGTGGASTTTATTSTSTTTTTSTTGTGGGSNTCVEAGGACEALTPGACLNGVVGDAAKYSCGSGVGVLCCLPCPNPCATVGETRCAGDSIQTCSSHAPGCNSWVISSPCPAGESCSSDGTQCITPSASCTTDAQCGCGCGCGGGACHCTGGIPPTCNADADCGPSCSGLLCVAHQCVQQVCTPGMDQTCNDNPGMNALAGACNVDGTCTCKQGFTLEASGRCG